jgi:hypothetical protein
MLLLESGGSSSIPNVGADHARPAERHGSGLSQVGTGEVALRIVRRRPSGRAAAFAYNVEHIGHYVVLAGSMTVVSET